MINSIRNYFFKEKPTQNSSDPILQLDTLDKRRFEHNDQFSAEYDRRVHKKYYLKNILVCNIEYGLHSGNIGHINVEKPYQRRKLGQQMLSMAIQDIKNMMYATDIYAFTSNGHPFWTGVFGGKFKFDEKRSHNGYQTNLVVCYSMNL